METVEGLLKSPLMTDVKCVVSILVSYGTEDMMRKKKEITKIMKGVAEFLGAEYEEIWTEINDKALASKLLKNLLNYKPDRIILSAVTGSRFVILPAIQAIMLYLGKYYKTEVYVVHGIEGNGWILEPLIGYLSPVLTSAEKKIFKLIYEHPKETLQTKDDLIQKYKLGRSVYKILSSLKKKGLIIQGRNKITKTYPGHLLYKIILSMEDNPK